MLDRLLAGDFRHTPLHMPVPNNRTPQGRRLAKLHGPSPLWGVVCAGKQKPSPSLKRTVARRTYRTHKHVPSLEYGTVLDMFEHDGCHIVLKNYADTFDDHDTDAMVGFMLLRPKQPNPYNAKTFLRRRQGCYTRGGCAYNVGQQNPVLGSLESVLTEGSPDGLPKWDRLVAQCVKQAAAAVYLEKLPGLPENVSTMGYDDILDSVVCAQVNVYEGGSWTGLPPRR